MVIYVVDTHNSQIASDVRMALALVCSVWLFCLCMWAREKHVIVECKNYDEDWRMQKHEKERNALWSLDERQRVIESHKLRSLRWAQRTLALQHELVDHYAKARTFYAFEANYHCLKRTKYELWADNFWEKKQLRDCQITNVGIGALLRDMTDLNCNTNVNIDICALRNKSITL